MNWNVGINLCYLKPATDRGYSSVVEHSTADREVPGSNPVVPYHYLFQLEHFFKNRMSHSFIRKSVMKIMLRFISFGY